MNDEIIDLTRALPVVAPRGRRDRRKQEKRLSKIDERLRQLEEEEMQVANEYEDLQTALVMSLTQEERDQRKQLLAEQQHAYQEALAADRAVRG